MSRRSPEQERWTKDQEELAWYRTLTVQRTEGVTSIDGGKTATKLHELWTERDRLRETVAELVETGSRVVASSVGDPDWISTMLTFRAAINRAIER